MPGLFDSSISTYEPIPSGYFQVNRIILTRGWDNTAEQRRKAESIMGIYPNAEIIDRSDQPHNRVDLCWPNALEAYYQGKKTLVLGVHKSAVRFSEEADNTCPNYWHFSPYVFCPFDCKYCYLAGTPGVKFSPGVKIYLNIEDILDQIDKTAAKLNKPTSFYLGKLQDGLALVMHVNPGILPAVKLPEITVLPNGDYKLPRLPAPQDWVMVLERIKK